MARLSQDLSDGISDGIGKHVCLKQYEDEPAVVTGSSFEVKKSGIYTLPATNICGSLKDSISITSQTCEPNMPSAFTPDKDGKNDVFKVKYPLLVKQFNLVIYNRWGQKVFESHDISKGWNGTIHNIDQIRILISG